jgi:hypothetical protein
VDVCGLLARGIDVMMNPHASQPTARPQLVPFTAAWLEHTDTSNEMTPRYS